MSVKHRFDEVGAQVRQVPTIAEVALRSAINATVKGGRVAVYAAMRRGFDRPTPYTLNSLRLEEAKEGQQAPRAAVMVKGRLDAIGGAVPAESYLFAQILGGTRRVKRFESALVKRGILPRGWYAVPGRNARMDGYGNMSAGQIVQIMSWLQLHRPGRGERLKGLRNNTSSKALKKARQGSARRFGTELVVSSPLQAYRRGGLPYGIYSRQSSTRTTRTAGPAAPLLPLVIFVKSVRYAPKLDFYGTLQQHAKDVGDAEMTRAVARARRSKPLKDAL